MISLPTIMKIASSAYSHYQCGLSITEAVNTACCGYGLDEFSRTLVESRVVVLICDKRYKDGDERDPGYASLAARIACRMVDPSVNVGPIIDRARAGALHEEEAAALSIAAYDRRIWDIIVGFVRDAAVPMLPIENNEGAAERQNRLAKQISSSALEVQLAVVEELRSTERTTLELDALVAATISKEIYNAVAQVRVAVTLTE